MRQSLVRLIPPGAGWTVMVALMLVASSGLRISADEPPSKDEAAKKTEATARLKDAALKEAEKYLVLLDKGKFAESWEASSENLRKGLQQRKWVNALSRTRKPFGALRSRKLNRIEMRASEDPERIDEAWVYCDLKSTSGMTTSELAIVIFERGKEWKVNNYFIGDPDNFPKPLEEEKEPEPAAKKGEKPIEKKATKPAEKKDAGPERK